MGITWPPPPPPPLLLLLSLSFLLHCATSQDTSPANASSAATVLTPFTPNLAATITAVVTTAVKQPTSGDATTLTVGHTTATKAVTTLSSVTTAGSKSSIGVSATTQTPVNPTTTNQMPSSSNTVANLAIATTATNNPATTSSLGTSGTAEPRTTVPQTKQPAGVVPTSNSNVFKSSPGTEQRSTIEPTPAAGGTGPVVTSKAVNPTTTAPATTTTAPTTTTAAPPPPPTTTRSQQEQSGTLEPGATATTLYLKTATSLTQDVLTTTDRTADMALVTTTPTTSSPTKSQTMTFEFPLNTKDEGGKELAEVCRRLVTNMKNGTCTLVWQNRSSKVKIESVEITATVDPFVASQHYDDVIKVGGKSTDNTTLIAILASCGALLIMIVILAACASHHRKPCNETQQHLTEELHTVENGYHDNPTLEVMEVQPEMQEKKMALNGEFNDSWIVPIDNLLKEDALDEEDTHL